MSDRETSEEDQIHTASVFGTWSTLSLLWHGHEVKCAVQTAVQRREIHVKGELVADKLKHLIVVRVLHQVHARADVRRVLALGNVLERHGVAAGGHSVSLRVVGALESAVLAAGSVGAT